MLEPGAPVDLTHMVMELCRETLSQYIDKDGSPCPFGLPVDQLRDFGRQLLEGLVHCHTNETLHLDIKPGNVLIAYDKKLRLADFGMAHRPGHLFRVDKLGTPEYLAPEAFLARVMEKQKDVDQGHREVVSRTISHNLKKLDMWAVGGTLYYLATGDHLVTRPDPMNFDHMLIQTLQIVGMPTDALWQDIIGAIISRGRQAGLHKTTLSDLPPTRSLMDISWRLADRIRSKRTADRINPEFARHSKNILMPNKHSDWNHVLDLLSKLLRAPFSRLSASDALQHPFFTQQQQQAAAAASATPRRSPPVTRQRSGGSRTPPGGSGRGRA
ncbi:unnamed protein product [Vitrella brassicaformis CCMP3155]|uniref:Protein kinase domain-containing protein n=2 Tax=Vitrella brassicaformis TaxID=1169539 RepID=A0A0G4FD58_VITBC|nr:unnamed protein product [Vitrella brassicaformis CCMP3155]|eukprot:CEM11097.1 unnamed protein product [Vitrella brassicaformis CCMP3155]